MFCVVFHTTATAMTMASAGPIRREHTPDGGISFSLGAEFAFKLLFVTVSLLFEEGAVVVFLRTRGNS